MSLKCRNKSIIVLDSAKLDSYKTSNLVEKLESLSTSSTLIVDVELDQNLVNSSANIPNVDVIPLIGLNVYDILRHQTLMISKEAIDVIEKRFAC